MLISHLASRVREELDESPQGVFFTDADVFDSLEDAYTYFCLYTGLLTKAYSLQIVANQVYYNMSQVSDYLRPVAVFNPNNNSFLKPITLLSLHKSISSWEKTSGTPEFFCPIPTSLIALYPHYSSVPSQNLTVYYKAWESNFDAQSDIELPPAAEDCMIYYAVSDLYDQILELEKSKMNWDKFITDFERVKLIVQNIARTGKLMEIDRVY